MKLTRRSFLATVSVGPALIKVPSVPIAPDTKRIVERVAEKGLDGLKWDSISVEPKTGTVMFFQNGQLLYSIDPGYGYEYNDGDCINIEGIEGRLPYTIDN